MASLRVKRINLARMMSGQIRGLARVPYGWTYQELRALAAAARVLDRRAAELEDAS